MGWTGYYPTHFNSGGKINRKAECDAYFTEGLNQGFYNLVKSSMVGSTYYAAVQPLKRYAHDANGNTVKDANGNYIIEDIPAAELETVGIVFLTQVEKGMFYYKNMSETCGPGCYECPMSILKVLSPTSNESANEWRKRCLEYHSRINPSKLPVGTVIRFNWNGKDMWLQKCAPNYQFKTSWWKVDGDYKYFSKRRIPEKFEVVKMGGK